MSGLKGGGICGPPTCWTRRTPPNSPRISLTGWWPKSREADPAGIPTGAHDEAVKTGGLSPWGALWDATGPPGPPGGPVWRFYGGRFAPPPPGLYPSQKATQFLQRITLPLDPHRSERCSLRSSVTPLSLLSTIS